VGTEETPAKLTFPNSFAVTNPLKMKAKAATFEGKFNLTVGTSKLGVFQG
jgi:hypothetical protein